MNLDEMFQIKYRGRELVVLTSKMLSDIFTGDMDKATEFVGAMVGKEYTANDKLYVLLQHMVSAEHDKREEVTI